jgi:hypothetical protein
MLGQDSDGAHRCLPQEQNDQKRDVLGLLHGDMEFIVDANKCTPDMKTCEKYANVNIQQMCEKMLEKNRFYSKIFDVVNPPVHCPIKPGNYSLTNSFIDLSIFNVMRLDGFVWVVKMKFVGVDRVTKAKKLLMCTDAQIEITKANTKP